MYDFFMLLIFLQADLFFRQIVQDIIKSISQCATRLQKSLLCTCQQQQNNFNISAADWECLSVSVGFRTRKVFPQWPHTTLIPSGWMGSAGWAGCSSGITITGLRLMMRLLQKEGAVAKVQDSRMLINRKMPKQKIRNWTPLCICA